MTQAMMVADWNARHPEVTPVDLFMDGRKFKDYEVTTSSYAYLNESQMACIKINVEDILTGLEVKVSQIKPKDNHEEKEAEGE